MSLGLRDWWQAQQVPVGEASAQLRAKTLTQFSAYDLLVPWWARYNEEAFVREAYRINALVHECIEYRCRAMSTATMYAMREVAEPDGKERLSKGHWLQRLLRRPSTLYPSQTAWMRQIERQLLITGECFIYLARPSSAGSGGRASIVEETQILPGSAIQVHPGKTGVKRYDYRPNGQVEPIPIQPEQMIFLRYDDPVDPIRGCSPLAAAWREIQADNSMSDYRKAFFDNAAIPGGVLTTNLPANSEQLRQWSEDFTDKFSGARNAGRTPALAGGLTYERAGAYPREVDFGEMGAIPEARITAAFSVPGALVGTKLGLANANYSNLKELKFSFWEDTVVPEMELLSDTFTVGFTRLEDDNFCEFDVSKVPGLQGQREQEQAIAKEALINGAITVNEYRLQVGYNPVEDGNVYYRPGSLTPVPEGDLDEKPPDPLELMEKQGELAAKQHISSQNGQAKAKDPTANKGGAPANKEKDQTSAPQPGSANDREETFSNYDERLLAILDEEHQQQNAAILGDRWDRALYVARVSGAVRKRLARIVRSTNKEVDSQALSDWLDEQTLELGNEAARVAMSAWGEDTQLELESLASEYTLRAMEAFRSSEEEEEVLELSEREWAEIHLEAAAIQTEVMDKGESAYQFKDEWAEAARMQERMNQEPSGRITHK